MGVNSLWDILEPSARPVRLEALSRKKLAVDASIWVYQFLKAVRDSEGNSLPNSHIVGFFRRICKLVYFGIYPVFVFDGGAPALKRKTIQARRERRDEKRQNTEELAQKILAVQLQRQLGDQKRSGSMENGDELTYLEDLPNLHPSHGSTSDQGSSGVFKKKDEYHLPSIEEFKVSADDSRIIPAEEYDEHDEDFDYVDGIDVNTIDPKSKEFADLPLSTQYMILWHLRLKSRLRMGFSKNQLERLFPSSMEFSKFQIQQVQKRNFYTQKLMDVSGMGEHGNTTKRIAGDKDRKYTLMKNDDGWTLSLGGEDAPNEPIVIDDDEEESSMAEVGDQLTYLPTHKSPEKISVQDSAGKAEDNDADDDSDWIDVAANSDNHNHNDDNDDDDDDDDELQKALVASIYQNYSDNKIQNISVESDLRLAIEKSKADLDGLQLKEQQLSKNNIVKWEHSKDIQETKPRKEMDISGLEDVNLGDSFLFGRPSKSDNKSAAKPNVSNYKSTVKFRGVPDVSDKANDKVRVIDKSPIFISSESSKSDDSVKVTEATDEHKKLSENENNGNEVQDNEMSDEGENSQKDEKRVINHELPVWFEENADHDKNIHKRVIEDADLQRENSESLDNKYKEDEKAGLISWTEAKNLMENSEEDSDSFEDVEEIEVVREGQAPTEKITPSKEEEPKVNNSSNNVDNNGGTGRVAKVIDYDFEEDEEENLVKQLQNEELEHAIFTSQLKQSSNMPVSLSNTKITEEQLINEKMQRAKRDSDEVTEGMISDVQELLRRFGIPFITAPMEAEAQCAELLRLGLVDGIITDDSDCFLFGGDKVYRNMFNQKQYVECFMMRDINARLGISRKELIEFALLLGSDYTEGIKGIGPVLAVEILAEFGSLENLKQWFDEHTKKITEKEKDLTSLKKTLLNRIKNAKLFLPDSFPDKVVFEAYEKPEVDRDETKFKWGVPNLDLIRAFLMSSVGWSQAKVDEVLVPLIRDINRKNQEGTQSTIGEFFTPSHHEYRSSVSMSKRMKAATTKLNKRAKKS